MIIDYEIIIGHNVSAVRDGCKKLIKEGHGLKPLVRWQPQGSMGSTTYLNDNSILFHQAMVLIAGGEEIT